MNLPGTAGYVETAERLRPRYEALDLEEIHAHKAGLTFIRERQTAFIQPDNRANGVHWIMLAY